MFSALTKIPRLPTLSYNLPCRMTVSGIAIYAIGSLVTITAILLETETFSVQAMVLSIFIVAAWSAILLWTIRHIDELDFPILGLTLLIILLIIAIGHEVFNVYRTSFPILDIDLERGTRLRSQFDDVFKPIGIIALFIAIIPSALRTSRLEALVLRVKILFGLLMSSPMIWLHLAGCLLWPGEAYQKTFQVLKLFVSVDRIGYLDTMEFIYFVNYQHGDHIFIIQSLALHLLFHRVYAISEGGVRRHLALLGYAIIVITVFIATFGFPVWETIDFAGAAFRQLIWSVPGLVLMLGSVVGAIFLTPDRKATLKQKTTRPT